MAKMRSYLSPGRQQRTHHDDHDHHGHHQEHESGYRHGPLWRRLPGPAAPFFARALFSSPVAPKPYNHRMRRWLLIGAAVLTAVVAAGAQRRFSEPYYRTDLKYDGRFTFVRLRWDSRPRVRAPGRQQRRLEPRLPARRTAPRPAAQGHHLHRRAHRRQPHSDARRSGALQVSDRLHVGAGLLGDER